MNKKYYFALVATAALFASCSSDDVVSGNSPALAGINDGDGDRIQIAVEQPGVTRGTGTVGGTTVPTNVWAGQTFNLFMFEKGTFNPAQKTVDDGQGGTMNVDIYNNAEMKTPDDGTTAATYVIGTEEQMNYYPTTGAYSFWAYRVDDAGTGTAGVGVPVGVGDNSATEVKIPFTIDGSQDILTAIPDEAGDLDDLKLVASTATADQIYTAYSSRRGITPTLHFKHQLTRLTFQVKAASREVSNAAASVGGIATYNGFKVTGITVKSKSSGNIIAAWKDGSSFNAQGIEFTNASEDWANPATLVSMPLKSRGQEVSTPQTGEFTNAITVTIAADGTPSYPANYTKGSTTYPVSTDLAVYDANTTNSYTGIPNGHLTTLEAMVAAYIANNTITPTPLEVTPGSISGYVYTKTADAVYGLGTNAAAQLVDLEPVTPVWDGYSAGTPATYQATDASATVADETAYDALDAALQAGKGDATALEAAKIAANEGKYFFVTGDKAYKIEEATAAVPGTVGSAVATNVGEALLVAPNAPKYEVTLTYKRWKKTSTSDVNEIEGSVTKEVTRNGGAYFNAGKSYNVIITLYKDGDASTDTNLEPWTPEEDINIEGED